MEKSVAIWFDFGMAETTMIYPSGVKVIKNTFLDLADDAMREQIINEVVEVLENTEGDFYLGCITELNHYERIKEIFEKLKGENIQDSGKNINILIKRANAYPVPNKIIDLDDKQVELTIDTGRTSRYRLNNIR